MSIKPEFALSPKTGYGDAVRLSWGLVQIPVRLFITTDGANSVPARSMFTSDGHPIGNRKYDKETGENYDGEVVKRVLVGAEFVELTDEEIEAHSTLTRGIAEIETFIPLSALADCYVVEKFGAWMPDSMKVGKTKVTDPTAAKASALLRRAMATKDVAALVLVPSKSGGKYVALLPDGRAAYLSYAESVRLIPDTADVEVSVQELGLADQLIDGIGVATPVLTDPAGALLRTYLEAKATGVATAVVTVAVSPAPVDLLASLAASLAATPPKAKPAKPATKVAPVKPAARKRTA